MNSYTGKHIWIIGASSGIGNALAIELARQGAHLILSARRADKLSALNAELGGAHIVLPFDAGDGEAFVKAAATLPKIDSVIFMAALYSRHSDKPKNIDFMHDMIRVNIGGAFNTVNAVRPIFEKQGHGQIALCGSVAGYRGLPYGQPYCATKAAIISYAESLKIELEGKNIDVKIINPGFVRTPLTDKNEFQMPMMIEADEAAKSLAKGLLSKRFEITFPKKFTLIMKIINILPAFIFFSLSRVMRNKQSG